MPRSSAETATSACNALGVAMAIPSTPTSDKSFNEVNTATLGKVRAGCAANSGEASAMAAIPAMPLFAMASSRFGPAPGKPDPGCLKAWLSVHPGGKDQPVKFL